MSDTEMFDGVQQPILHLLSLNKDHMSIDGIDQATKRPLQNLKG